MMPIAVADAETDPFEYNCDPEPFAFGFYTGEYYRDFWGTPESVVVEFTDFLKSLKEKHLIYFHNGGKFDLFFLLDYIDNPIFIINGRIVECHICGHVIRDSYSILPMPLSAYAKDTINYNKFKERHREKYKVQILSYLRSDCVYLFDLVSAFVKRFTGKRSKMPPLTIGSTALKELRKMHPQRLDSSEDHDSFFRPYYFGGRVQCFESGVIEGNFEIYDVNSMYPAVMRNYKHPGGTKYFVPHKITFDETGEIIGFESCVFFIRFSGVSMGHVPYRNDDGGIDFLPQCGEFYLCSHEFKAAYSRGLLELHEILDVRVCATVQSFGEFVDKFAEQKIAAKRSGDQVAEIFAKLILNSSYGKFAINSRKFRDYMIEKLNVDEPPDPEVWKKTDSGLGYRIWEKPIDELKFNDVAVAASITSAARAVLMDGIYRAKRVIYCDTDSLICESPGDLPIDSAELGKWKYEGKGVKMAVGGKKMYALCGIDKPKKAPETARGLWVIKKASKGVALTGEEIFRVAEGKTVVHMNPAPSYNIKNSRPTYTRRSVRKTGV
jgi:hypothetical protein